VLLAKHPLTTRRTKFALNKSFDMSVESALALEVADPADAAGAAGHQGFYQQAGSGKATQNCRRTLEIDFPIVSHREAGSYATTHRAGSG